MDLNTNKEKIFEKLRIEDIPDLLKDPNLFDIINKEFDKFIVDEEETRKAIFISACGSFVENLSATFNVFIGGDSSAGKSWVCKNVLNIFPKRVFSKETYRTRISPKVLTYWHNYQVEPEWTWNGKILYLEDVGDEILNSDVFKVMISEGSTATIVGRSKIKDAELPATYDIEIIGKPITFITTAMGTPIDEIKNRFLMLDLNETEEQTEKIMQRQIDMAISGKKEYYDEEITKALDGLRRVKVIIPKWINNIMQYIPRKEILRWRREFPRFLEIIKCSAALHQYQRKKNGDDEIIANEKDYEIARTIIGKITASSGVEGLTNREKNSYEYIKQFYRENGKGCTRAQIWAFKPIYSDRQWDTILQQLSAKGLLNVKLEINEDTNRKNSFYYPIEFENLILPEFIIFKDSLLINNNQNGSNGTNSADHVITSSREDANARAQESKNIVFTSITSTSLMIIKENEPFNLTLEAGKQYPLSYFGDNAEEVVDLLEKDGKLK